VLKKEGMLLFCYRLLVGPGSKDVTLFMDECFEKYICTIHSTLTHAGRKPAAE
jgi:hypothetical protein